MDNKEQAMSKIGELAIEIENLYFTEGLYPEEIAALTGLSIEEITSYLNDLEPDYYDDSMDGDHESALASAGWGTDEDYGDFGGDNDW